jgi:Tfp pilus assembly protein PilE
MMSRNAHRGDTLVEVLMSVVILSMVIVGAMTMMSRGLGASLVATEHTQSRLQVSQQTEMLHYLRDGYLQDKTSALAGAWTNVITNYANTNSSAYGGCAVSAGKNAFYLDQADPANIVKNYNASIVPSTSAVAGQGLWVEATNSSGAAPAYTDFQIHACWAGPGSSGQQQVVTTVRLYDPSR